MLNHEIDDELIEKASKAPDYRKIALSMLRDNQKEIDKRLERIEEAVLGRNAPSFSKTKPAPPSPGSGGPGISFLG